VLHANCDSLDGQNHNESFVSHVEDCHVEFSDKMLSLASIVDRLGGSYNGGMSF
jgi:hypothetical protein